MNIFNVFFNFFSEFNSAFTLFFVLKLAGIAAGTIVLWRMKPRWRNAAFAVVFILMMRLVLFENPFIWGYHFKTLSADDVGWRQQSALGVEYYKYFKIIKPKKYMAVGSSQSYVIYMPYSQDHKDLIIFNLAGMTPLDMFFYRQYIVDRKPENILLYLSEFDLAKIPNLDAVKIGPNQGIGLLRELPVLLGILKLAPPNIALYEMIAGEFLPEYKYSFIFRGYWDKWTGKQTALNIKSKLDELSPDQQEMAKGISDLIEELNEQWIPFNTYFLEEFLAFCQQHGIKVIITEGQYNPKAYTEKTSSLNTKTRKVLEQLDRKFDAVTFLPRSQTMEFTAEDYIDAVHVRSVSGIRYAQDLMGKIGSANSP